MLTLAQSRVIQGGIGGKQIGKFLLSRFLMESDLIDEKIGIQEIGQ